MNEARLLVPEVGEAQRRSVLGRTDPLVKLGIAVVWLIGLGLTLDLRPPLILIVVAVIAGVELGAIEPGALLRRIAPLATAALGIAVGNLVFAAANADPLATEVARIGPLRLTEEGIAAASAIAARVGAIVTVGAVFALTTDSTRLVDSLVQLARVPARFAYGALAAYQAVPRLAEDLATLRSMRRLRGLRGWHPRLVVGLLVRAIRHADQLAVAMDARGFGARRRSIYRPVGWTPLDALLGGAALVLLIVVLVVTR